MTILEEEVMLLSCPYPLSLKKHHFIDHRNSFFPFTLSKIEKNKNEKAIQ